MQKIDVELVYNRSMLSIPEEEKAETIRKFNDVVEAVENMFNLDTEGVEFYEITSEISCPLREDIPKASIDREDALKNTDHREYGYFRFGKVIE